MDRVVATVSAFVLSTVLTKLVLVWAGKRNVVSPIRERDVHSKSIPRIGGLAIFASFFIVALVFHFLKPQSLSGFGFPFAVFGLSIDKRLLAVLLAGLVLVAGMALDDIRGLSAYQKLGIQVLVALIIVAGGIGVDYINNPFGGAEFRLDMWKIPIALAGVTYHFVVLADLLTIAWLVFLMNVLNFSDGVDGLAGTVSMIALGVLAILSVHPPVLQPATALLSSIALGAVGGFLMWNAPPAKIFMGDTGSMFLGFLIGVIGLIAGGKLATTLVVLAIPIIDAFTVLASRVIKGKNPFTSADQSHLHHRFLRAGFSVWQILFVLGGLSLLFGAVALQSGGIGKVELSLVALVLTFAIIGAVELRARRNHGRI